MIKALTPFIHLARLHRPIGILLLLWPALWALWVANQGTPPWQLLLIFTLGSILMRSAGCVINDLCDQKFDAHVWRTAQRPLVTGQLSRRQALYFALFLICLSFCLALMLDLFTILLSGIGLLLAATYPLAKRIFAAPQLHLGFAFGFAIPMAFSASYFYSHPQPISLTPAILWQSVLSFNSLWLYSIAIIWAVAYDTQYAMADRNDDLKLGICSTAILFGRWDLFIVGFLQVVVVAMLAVVGFVNHLSFAFFVLLACLPLFFLRQYLLTRFRQPTACLQAFIHNHWVGLWVFIAFAIGT